MCIIFVKINMMYKLYEGFNWFIKYLILFYINNVKSLIFDYVVLIMFIYFIVFNLLIIIIVVCLII